ncbi:related to carboxypeptidase C (cathepsin A) [Lecanosticta acicola]|uniref:Carboxypeptidase n=1 Tax=Lecanosticta acicola TaxID=111012 RepID=A0AAI8Z902_9PEZI|nr:related to carboxypeptidase C (cathepsin A) [Lecanosticta acicola]
MLFKNCFSTAALLVSAAHAFLAPRALPEKQLSKRVYYPAPVTDFHTITTPGSNITIRYKIPSEEGVCETTPGVRSYSGYVDLSEDVHVFFWFFESRRNPAEDDFTLWLNGGPGSDSLIGLFEELGPCRITPELETVLNPYSWNNVSNLLFLSQPVGVAFSYQAMTNGSLGTWTGDFLNATQAPVTGTWSTLVPENEGEINTTDLAAPAAWEVLQALLEALPQLQNNRATAPKKFNLWTESYGGHYGPAFFNYFYKQNEKIKDGSVSGYAMEFNTLGLINAIIDETIQAGYWPEFAVNNTYGIKVYNDTVYSYAKFANEMIGGCQDQIQGCIQAAQDINGGYVQGKITKIATAYPAIAALCSEAQVMCQDNVESLYYRYGDRGTYDIRHPTKDPTAPSYYEAYLNQAHIQQALGVSVNYTGINYDVWYGFQSRGDWVYPNFLLDLQEIIASGVRVALIYGDADYICNWFGGQAVSLAVNHTHKAEFAAAGYEPMIYGGIQYGEVRERGNFSFTRIYQSGHEIPYYQPQAALAHFQRVIEGVDIPQGLQKVTANWTSTGPENSTRTESFVPLPPTDSAGFAVWSSSIVASYDALDRMPPPTQTP